MQYRDGAHEAPSPYLQDRSMTKVSADRTTAPNSFAARHVGPRADDIRAMLDTLGYDSLEAFISAVVPESIRLRRDLALAPGMDERSVLDTMRVLASQNKVYRSWLGMGY